MKRESGSAMMDCYFAAVSSNAGASCGSGSRFVVESSDSRSLERRLSLTGLVVLVGEVDMLCWIAGGDACGMLCDA